MSITRTLSKWQKTHQQPPDTFCRGGITYEVLWVCMEPKVASSALPLEAERLNWLPGNRVNSIFPYLHSLFDYFLSLPRHKGDNCSERLIPEEFRM